MIMLFYSILFYLFYSILFYSILFYSILFYSILFYSILFYSILFYLFYSILFYSIYPILFHSIGMRFVDALQPLQTLRAFLLALSPFPVESEDKSLTSSCMWQPPITDFACISASFITFSARIWGWKLNIISTQKINRTHYSNVVMINFDTIIKT